MKYLLLICADGLPSSEDLEVLQRECPRWADEMDSRGVRLLGRELDLPESAATVRVRDGETLVTDGPFAETKEFVAGFDVIECAGGDEAIEVAAKHPSSWFQAIEVRPLGEGAELGENVPAFARFDDSAGIPYLLTAWNDSGAATLDAESLSAATAAWRAELGADDRFVLGGALGADADTTTVRVRDGSWSLRAGGSDATERFIAGIDVFRCTDRGQAIELAASHPLARQHAIEVRPFWSE